MIDILEGYIQTSERFRVIRVFFGVPESYGNSPGSIWALLGFRGKREERLPPPQGLVRIGLGEGLRPLLPSLLFPLSLTPTPTTWKGEGGILLPVGVGLLLGAPPPGRTLPPP